MKAIIKPIVMREKSSVAVEKKTRIRLDSMGFRNETYDQIITRLMDHYDDTHKQQKNKTKDVN